MRLKLLLFSLALVVGGRLCAQSYGAMNSTMECIDVNLDGSLVLRVSGMGQMRPEAKRQACKNAVYNVMFRGVKTEDRNSRYARPLFFEANAAERHADFVEQFFRDGGDYTRFVHIGRYLGHKRVRIDKDRQRTRFVTVVVDYPQLETYLIGKNLIKK